MSGGEYIVVKTSLGEYVVRRDLMYTESDEWVKVTGSIAVVGISDYAQKKLRHIVNVELPEVGRSVRRGENIAVIESVKAIADIYAPISGRVIDVNKSLLEHPEYINNDPYGLGWVVKLEITNLDEVNELLTPEQYAEKIKRE